MTDPSTALADLLAARDAARDLQYGVGDAIAGARALCSETRWRAQAAAAFHDAVAAWTGDLVDVQVTLADLEDEASAAATRLAYLVDHAFEGAAG